MRQSFSLYIIIIFLLAINFGLVFQYRHELQKQDALGEELRIDNSQKSYHLSLVQEAMALSGRVDPQVRQHIQLPADCQSGAVAIRLTDQQCSSCVDMTLAEVQKYLTESGVSNFFVLYTAKHKASITMGFRERMLGGAPFVSFPEDIPLTGLDSLNLPYLVYIDGNGLVRSAYLPYPVPNPNILLYLKQTLKAK